MGKDKGALTHSMVAAIEDLTAVGLDAKMVGEIALLRIEQRRVALAVAEAQDALTYVVVRINKMMTILHTVRQGPHSYRRDEAENLENKPE